MPRGPGLDEATASHLSASQGQGWVSTLAVGKGGLELSRLVLLHPMPHDLRSYW